MLRWIPVLVLLVVSWAHHPAHADGYVETEYRLKTAGIDEPFRERIHAGIRRAVKRLRSLQAKDGGFPGGVGPTVLAGLALRHAGTPEGNEGARAAIRYLVRRGKRALIENTYEGGIAAMLLQADGSQPKLLAKIHANLAKGPGPNGYWGYVTTGGVVENLSTAQFAALGLWAGERAGAETATVAWRRHLDALLSNQQPGGSWAYRQDMPFATPDGGDYTTGTFMGLAGLALASAALRDETAGDDTLAARLIVGRAKGMAALRRDVLATLDRPGGVDGFGIFAFYRLYALEKVCIFVGQHSVGGVAWYAEGADLLLRTQSANGGWDVTSLDAFAGTPQYVVPGTSGSIETSFALLFLLRASESYRPITPRPIEGRPVTSGGTPPAPESAPEPPPPPSLTIATKVLDRLQADLDATAPLPLAATVSALRFIRLTYARSRTGNTFLTEAHDTWCRRAEALLLRAVDRMTGPVADRAPTGRLHDHAVSFAALETLAHTHPRVGVPLMRRVTTAARNKTIPNAIRQCWYGSALETLRVLDPPSLDAWLRTHVVRGEPEHAARTAAALVTLGGRAGTMTGAERRAAVRALLDVFRPRIIRGKRSFAQTDRLTRRLLRTCLMRLATPWTTTGVPKVYVTALATDDPWQYLRWWGQHSKPDDPAWSDG